MRHKAALGVAVGAVALVGFLVLAESTKQDPPTPNDPAVGVTSPYSDEQLHEDYDMTRQMTDPTTAGPMSDGRQPDPQLEHSEDPAFVDGLEQHDDDMDRMLGEGSP